MLLADIEAMDVLVWLAIVLAILGILYLARRVFR